MTAVLSKVSAVMSIVLRGTIAMNRGSPARGAYVNRQSRLQVNLDEKFRSIITTFAPLTVVGNASATVTICVPMSPRIRRVICVILGTKDKCEIRHYR